MAQKALCTMSSTPLKRGFTPKHPDSMRGSCLWGVSTLEAFYMSKIRSKDLTRWQHVLHGPEYLHDIAEVSKQAKNIA